MASSMAIDANDAQCNPNAPLLTTSEAIVGEEGLLAEMAVLVVRVVEATSR